jgi:hypothetical protein
MPKPRRLESIGLLRTAVLLAGVVFCAASVSAGATWYPANGSFTFTTGEVLEYHFTEWLWKQTWPNSSPTSVLFAMEGPYPQAPLSELSFKALLLSSDRHTSIPLQLSVQLASESWFGGTAEIILISSPFTDVSTSLWGQWNPTPSNPYPTSGIVQVINEGADFLVQNPAPRFDALLASMSGSGGGAGDIGIVSDTPNWYAVSLRSTPELPSLPLLVTGFFAVGCRMRRRF